MRQFDAIKNFVMSLTDEVSKDVLVSRVVVELSIPRKVAERSISELIVAGWLNETEKGNFILNSGLKKVNDEKKSIEIDIERVSEHFLKINITSKDRMISEMYNQIQKHLREIQRLQEQEKRADSLFQRVREQGTEIEKLKSNKENKQETNKEILLLKEQFESEKQELKRQLQFATDKNSDMSANIVRINNEMETLRGKIANRLY